MMPGVFTRLPASGRHHPYVYSPRSWRTVATSAAMRQRAWGAAGRGHHRFGQLRLPREACPDQGGTQYPCQVRHRHRADHQACGMLQPRKQSATPLCPAWVAAKPRHQQAERQRDAAQAGHVSGLCIHVGNEAADQGCNRELQRPVVDAGERQQASSLGVRPTGAAFRPRGICRESGEREVSPASRRHMPARRSSSRQPAHSIASVHRPRFPSMPAATKAVAQMVPVPMAIPNDAAMAARPPAPIAVRRIFA